jgi:hypothetical protein
VAHHHRAVGQFRLELLREARHRAGPQVADDEPRLPQVSVEEVRALQGEIGARPEREAQAEHQPGYEGRFPRDDARAGICVGKRDGEPAPTGAQLVHFTFDVARRQRQHRMAHLPGRRHRRDAEPQRRHDDGCRGQHHHREHREPDRV